MLLKSIIFARTACESVKMIIFNGLKFLVFLMLVFRVFEILHSILSNKCLFFPKYWHFFCHLFTLSINQTIAVPGSLVLNFELSVKKVILAWVLITSCISFFLDWIITY